MNSIQIFNNEEFGNIRSIVINGEPWFVGKDVATALGYSDPRSTVSKKVDIEDRGVAEMETPSGKQKMTIINESGIYALIFGSKLPLAKEFKHWVTSEVLPTLRKTGTYSLQPEPTPSYMIEDDVERAQRWIEERQETLQLAKANEVLTDENEQLKTAVKVQKDIFESVRPSVQFANKVKKSAKAITLRCFSGILHDKENLDINYNDLFTFFRSQNYICSAPDMWNKPTQKMLSKGYLQFKEFIDRQGYVSYTPVITGEGQVYFTKKILDAHQKGKI